MVFELDLQRGYQAKASVPANVRFELLSADKVQHLFEVTQYLSQDEARHRIAEGHLCIAGYVDGIPAYSSWLALGPVRVDYLDVTVVPGPAAAFSYEVYVAPFSRCLGLAKFGVDFRARLLREGGVQRCFSVVVPENQAGLAHTLACGFRPIGRAYCLRLGGFERFWFRKSSESVPLRFET